MLLWTFLHLSIVRFCVFFFFFRGGGERVGCSGAVAITMISVVFGIVRLRVNLSPSEIQQMCILGKSIDEVTDSLFLFRFNFFESCFIAGAFFCMKFSLVVFSFSPFYLISVMQRVELSSCMHRIKISCLKLLLPLKTEVMSMQSTIQECLHCFSLPYAVCIQLRDVDASYPRIQFCSFIYSIDGYLFL